MSRKPSQFLAPRYRLRILGIGANFSGNIKNPINFLRYVLLSNTREIRNKKFSFRYPISRYEEMWVYLITLEKYYFQVRVLF